MSLDKTSWKHFMALCLDTKEPKALSLLLDLFLTAEEKENLAMRYLIIKALLKKNKTQRQIAKELNVSIAKITRGSNELKRMSPELLQFLKENI